MSDSIWICKWRLVREHSVIFYPRRENVINHMNKAEYQSNVLQRAWSTVELLAGQENMLNLTSNWIRKSNMILQYSLRQEQHVCSTYLAIAVMRDQIMIDLQHSQILSLRKQCTLFWVILKNLWSHKSLTQPSLPDSYFISCLTCKQSNTPLPAQTLDVFYHRAAPLLNSSKLILLWGLYLYFICSRQARLKLRDWQLDGAERRQRHSVADVLRSFSQSCTICKMFIFDNPPQKNPQKKH